VAGERPFLPVLLPAELSCPSIENPETTAGKRLCIGKAPFRKSPEICGGTGREGVAGRLGKYRSRPKSLTFALPCQRSVGLSGLSGGALRFYRYTPTRLLKALVGHVPPSLLDWNETLDCETLCGSWNTLAPLAAIAAVLSLENEWRLRQWANLRAEIEQLCLDFIRTELETSRVFATLAATEHQIGDREAAEHCTRESEKAYHTVIRSLSRVTCAEERREFETKLRGLRETLDDLHQRIAK
jgi:hypothetical protein